MVISVGYLQDFVLQLPISLTTKIPGIRKTHNNKKTAGLVDENNLQSYLNNNYKPNN